MTSDEERREIADGLRRLADGRHGTGVPDSEILDVLGISAADTPDRSDARDVEILADIIDRPTCKDVYVSHSFGFSPCVMFKCSRCGASHASLAYFNYCPTCGAEITEV